MNQYFEKISNIIKKNQEPFQAMADLNLKTIKNYTYFNPGEYANLKKPEEILEKQVEIAISNGQKTLDYLQKTYQIIEKAMLAFVKECNMKENKSSTDCDAQDYHHKEEFKVNEDGKK